MSRAELDKAWAKTFRGMCYGCGFLGIRSHATTVVGSADLKQRQAGKLFKDEGQAEAEPWCIKGTTNLYRETIVNVVQPDPTGWATKGEFLELLEAELRKVLQHRERDCPDWGPYWDGFTPKEMIEIEWHERMNAGNTRVQIVSMVVSGTLALAGLALAWYAISTE